MIKITKSVAAAGSMLLLAHASHAAFSNGDVVLGFTGAGNTSVPNDYVIDLGNASTIVGVGGTAQVNLSSQVSQFNSVFAGGLSGLQMGAVGGNNTLSATLYATALRTSNLGIPGMSGSIAPGFPGTPGMFPNTVAKSGVGAVQQMVNGLNITGPGGSATPLFADANSWNTQIAPTTGNPNNFLGLTGYNPNGIATSSVIVEDLYKGVNSGGTVSMNYVGYFTFDNTGASPSFGFTPSAFVPVPEPATYGLMAGVGLLLLSLRRQLGKA